MKFFIDTHSHLYAEQFDNNRPSVIENAVLNGIEQIILPGIDSAYVARQKDTLQQFPRNVRIAYGLHPTSVGVNFQTELDYVEALIKTEIDAVAVGEIGVDLYWDKTFIEQQKEAFAFQISLAKEAGLPVIIHVRDAFAEAFEVVDRLNDDKLSGVFHSFSGTENDARKILEYGRFKLGINGTITYKKSTLPEIVQKIGIEHLVAETDAPWLPPVPHRGKRNEPVFMLETVKKLMEIFHLSQNEISEILYQNTLDIFPRINN